MADRERPVKGSIAQIAAAVVTSVELDKSSTLAGVTHPFKFSISLRGRQGEESFSADGEDSTDAVVKALEQLASKPFRLIAIDRLLQQDGQCQYIAAITFDPDNPTATGVGRFVTKDEPLGLSISILRAMSHAGCLPARYRANNQKALRAASIEMLEELRNALSLGSLAARKQCEAEGIILEYLNRNASAAVVTATNSPVYNAVLNLYDTSAWLYDSSGSRRESNTDTDQWLAWYPGLANSTLTVNQVLATLPAAPESEIPWIVRLFESPKGWLRLRGAIDLESHDVMHILLGRGLQDQDEAFVLGFAMGTTKTVTRAERWLFQMILSRLYPEPFRIPRFLLPAFDLGVEAGKRTGTRCLYKRPLLELKTLTLAEARQRCEIDVTILREFYHREQQSIPSTVASVRLPVYGPY